MTATDFSAILPMILIAAASVAVMLAVAVRRHHAVSAAITLLGLALAFAALWPASAVVPRQVTALLLVDRFALFFTGLVIAGTLAVAVLTWSYLSRRQGDHDEMYILLLVSALGAVVLTSASHFASFFLGLELLSVPLYVMIAYLHARKQSVEAALKYMILAGAASAFLLFGMALVYAEMGTLAFAHIAGRLAGSAQGGSLVLLPALALILVGIGFKLAVVPFHMWTPDVYEGAPAPVTAFIATVSKCAVFALMLRLFEGTGAGELPQVSALFDILAIASMVAGNVLALLQRNVKRLLAYSSIAHLGYILVAFQVGGDFGMNAVAFYFVAYFVTLLGAFGIVGALAGPGRDADQIDDYRGLFWRRPLIAGVFTAMLLSLAGIPLTAGFLAKFYVVAAGASTALWLLILTLVVTSGVGVYYYLRVIVALYATETAAGPMPAVPTGAGVVLGVLTAALLFLGVYPGPLLDVIRATVRF
ncbi:MAG TPA: NADH-quinone oxidoreductase subunit N [Bryobacteraceae bacterium]|nr:NADH-quinone oxidoreductase subunit N [Bryobacteraceae bacterium]